MAEEWKTTHQERMTRLAMGWQSAREGEPLNQFQSQQWQEGWHLYWSRNVQRKLLSMPCSQTPASQSS